MSTLRTTLLLALAAATPGLAAGANAGADSTNPSAIAPTESGEHDFDFFVGEWTVRHQRSKERLTGNQEWEEFDGTCVMRKLMGGYANVDDNVINLPGGAYRAVSLRSYDAQTAQWSIWWLDGRSPSSDLAPPVRGRFEQGIGTFYADDTLRGQPIRVRYTWSHITAKSARWEQAFSADQGRTWEVNWRMTFTRIGAE